MIRYFVLILVLFIHCFSRAQFTNNMTWSNPTCNGDCDGTATANPGGGTTPYFYLWSSNTGSQTTRVATGLCSGTYSVTISDNNSNIITGNVTLSDPTAVNTTITPTQVTCNGNSDGAADLTPSGGLPNSALSFNGANDYVVADIVAGGGYSNGITAEAWVWPDPSWTNSDAMIVAFNTNGFNNHFFMGYNASNNRFFYFDNVAGNRFSANTFATGNWYHVAVTITAGNFMRLYVNGVQEATFATTNVWIPQSDSYFSIGQEWDGLNLPSQFWWGRIDELRIWNMQLSSATISNNYSNCCPVTSSHPNYANLVAYYSMNEASGNNVGDRSGNGNSGRFINGATWVSPANAAYGCFAEGTGYHYEWSTSESTEDISNLAAGTYTVTVNDGNCCSATDVITITEPLTLNTSVTNTDVGCYGNSDGSGTVNASGGTSPYSYQWDSNAGNQTTQTATGLSQGTYYVTVTDNNGCTGIDSVLVSEPTPLSSSASSSDALCSGDNTGMVSVNASGGSTPYTYTWSSGGANASDSLLMAGWYFVTITDSNGCVTVDSALVGEPAPLSPSIISSTDASCYGDCDGSVTLSCSGGTSPYSYDWSDSQTGSSATGLCAGTYYVTISDSNNCDTVISMLISEPSPLISSISPDTFICLGESITLFVQATGSLLWSTGDTNSSINVSPSVNSSYEIIVSNAPCSDTAVVNVSVYPPLSVEAGNDTTIGKGGSAILNGSGGSNLYWWPSTGLSCTNCPGPVASPTVTTTYYLSDSTICASVDSVTVYVNDSKEIYLPNIFSPNGDGNNDVFYVRGSGIESARMIIYDRWGNKIFESPDINIGWDGTYKEKPVNAGVFVYLVTVTFFDGDEKQYKGNITLLR